MGDPEGTLTPTQHEIMDIVWDSGDDGVATSEIWQRIQEKRDVGRTTIVNQVDRLEKRGWLKRRKTDGNLRFTAAMKREEVETQLASEFVEHFFSGSVSRLVSSLFGSDKLSDADVEEIRKLVRELPVEQKKKR